MLSFLSRPLRRLFYFTPLFLDFLAPTCYAFEAKVLQVIDGDTLIVAPTTATNPQEAALNVRLYGIDAPEMGQPHGLASRNALAASALVGEVVEVTSVSKDRHDRIVGIVICQGKVLNLEQIRSGNAWLHEKYCRMRFCPIWKKEQSQAQQAKDGLWSDENPVPPWEWRKKIAP